MRRVVVLRCIPSVHRGRPFDPLFVLFVASLALVLGVFLGVRRAAAACDAHKISRVRAQLHHSSLRHLKVANATSVGASTHCMMKGELRLQVKVSLYNLRVVGMIMHSSIAHGSSQVLL